MIGQTSTKGPEEKTDNELIAEFMGAKPDTVHTPIGEYVWFDKAFLNFHLFNKKNLQYNSSWDWLMPVVDKIESSGIRTQIHRSMLDHTCVFYNGSYDSGPIGGMTKIECVYKSVVDFVKWYNQQPK